MTIPPDHVERRAATQRATPHAMQHAPSPRVLLVSDVRLYRDGLTLALGQRDELRVIGTAADADEAQRAVARDTPDVVLLDTGMADALDLARALRTRAPATKIVAFAVAESGADVVACAEAGIAGYVPRDAAVDDVVASVQAVVRGELRCSPRMAASLFERLAALSSSARSQPVQPVQPVHLAPAATPAGPLTQREREIVGLIDEGLSNKEIGRRLQIGTATVKNHVHHILEKLRVRRRAEAAARLRQARI